MSNIKDMNVSTVMDSISKGEIKVKDIAVAFGKTERTIQKHIKLLGYVWNASEKHYESIGEGYDKNNDDKNISEFISPTVTSKLDKMQKKKKEGRINSTIKVDSSTIDSIDTILLGNSINNSRVQRAYYLDKDIATIIDRVDGKQKSNLVNECLRKVFSEKGLL